MEGQATAILGEVVSLVPEATYEGKVYDQRVVVRLADGTSVALFDYQVVVTPHMVGSTFDLQILSLAAQAEHFPIPRFGLEITRGQDGEEAHFYGRVTAVEPRVMDRRRATSGRFVRFTLDIGIGAIAVQTGFPRGPRANEEAHHQLRVGDFVHTWGGRLDLIAVSRISQAGF